tara:strand:- start:23 stop:247 length:225 start_codon:yes stop_codon:yes gene_type:complete
MKMMFRDQKRIYEVEVNKDEVVICDKFEGEKLSMSRHGFRNFLEWMSEETRPWKKESVESQTIDVWDLSVTDKK